MEKDFDKLIGGIMAFLLGGFVAIYWRRIRDFFLSRHKTIWGSIIKRPINVTKWDFWLATIFILVLGIGLLTSGIYLLYCVCQEYLLK
ncbi:MAG: hypothetical protein V1709_10690 [Planctomycetota bacterium]